MGWWVPWARKIKKLKSTLQKNGNTARYCNIFCNLHRQYPHAALFVLHLSRRAESPSFSVFVSRTPFSKVPSFTNTRQRRTPTSLISVVRLKKQQAWVMQWSALAVLASAFLSIDPSCLRASSTVRKLYGCLSVSLGAEHYVH